MERNFEGAKKEVVLIILPLLVLLIVKLLSNKLESFLMLSDFSLASSIMYGQLLAKTLDVPDKNKDLSKFSSAQVYIFSFSILSITTYLCFQLLDDIHIAYYWVQLVFFIVGLFFYIPLSTLLDNLKKESYQRQ
tara:strand:+ start:279 stop:680 length:402 start_codon:yes stop_codon:yes gene_type:complete